MTTALGIGAFQHDNIELSFISADQEVQTLHSVHHQSPIPQIKPVNLLLKRCGGSRQVNAKDKLQMNSRNFLTGSELQLGVRGVGW